MRTTKDDVVTMPDTPLNPDALRVATTAAHDAVDWQMYDVTKFDLEDSVDVATIAAVSAYLAVAQPEAQKLTDAEWQAFQAIPDQGYSHRAWVDARIAERVAVAQPEVTGEQVNLAGWTCNGIHEPGDYSTCEECRDACDDLARFYNHMMRNPRPFKHWTGSPEVQP